MRKSLLVIPALGVFFSVQALAHEEMHLPPGPIKDRHELMENIGANAKKIGEALKAHDSKPIPAAAEAIAADAAKIDALFPAGSTSEQSRAKPEIWTDWAKFQKGSADLATHATALAATAKSGGDAGAAAKVMFGDCKSCHDDFRKPEDKEKN